MLRILVVANRVLPESDPRIMHAKKSRICLTSFALPQKTSSLLDESYMQVGMEEGFRLKYLLDFVTLFFLIRSKRKSFDLIHFYSTNLILIGPILESAAGSGRLRPIPNPPSNRPGVFRSSNDQLVLVRWQTTRQYGPVRNRVHRDFSLIIRMDMRQVMLVRVMKKHPDQNAIEHRYRRHNNNSFAGS